MCFFLGGAASDDELVVSLGVEKSPSLAEQQHNARAYGTVASVFVFDTSQCIQGFVVVAL